MNKKALLPLALTLLAAGMTGCAHQTVRNGYTANYGMGLVKIDKGSYKPAPVSTIDVNTNESFGDPGQVSGVQTQVLWGLFTFTDY